MANNYSNRHTYIHNMEFPATPSEPLPTFPSVLNVESEGLARGMSRRSFENSHLLSNVIREFQQHVETARMVNSRGITISNLLNPSTVDFVGQRNVNNQLGDSVVINLDTGVTSRPAGISHDGVALNTPDEVANVNINPANDVNNPDTARNVLEAQQSLQFLLKYLPFCLILLSKTIYDHCEGIFNLIILCATFIHANSVVKREAIAQIRRSLCKLSTTLLYILACFAFIAYVFEDEKLYLNLVFIPPYKQPSTVWDLLWATGLTDFILKLITIKFKIMLTMLPAWIIPYQKRGKIYLFIEAVSQLYRSLATIQPWLFYLLESYQGAEKIVGVFLSAAYMVSKGSDLMSRLKLFKTAILKLLQNVALGAPPSKDEIQNAGNHCPICHDAYDSPVLLQCRHIFCESCVSTWFDREQTCPLCRAKIVDDPSWRDGSTTFFIQLF